MSKTSLIIKREYLTRVRKKSFLVMTILGPILFAAMMIVPIWMAQIEDTEEKLIAVVDSSGMFRNVIPDSENLRFEYLENEDIELLKNTFKARGFYGVLYISHIVTYAPNTVIFYSDKQPGISVNMHISNALEKEIEDRKLAAYNIENLDEIMASVKTNISIRNFKITDDGSEKESNAGVSMAVGYASGFLIYLFIFLFGAQVMRGVIEEKTSRIVEVMVSSVKPFQLMMGKIVGIALVGLTQFVLWIILTFTIVTVVQATLFPELSQSPTQQALNPTGLFEDGGQAATGENAAVAQEAISEDMVQIQNVLEAVRDINIGVMIGSFIFYFLGGYLLYGSLFAAIGGAVDNETDTQQFMFPITIPLIIGIFVMINTINSPESPLSFWFSIIPLTSPIVMMVRIPFGVPYWELALSAALLILTFIFTTWLAGKIYRVGILMYGKKVNYAELWKWIRYKN